jgi:hypothetical protein
LGEEVRGCGERRERREKGSDASLPSSEFKSEEVREV